MTQEQKFIKALEDIFLGAPAEGESGFINLMRIESRHYEWIIPPASRGNLNGMS